jgi:hypothetical protein
MQNCEKADRFAPQRWLCRDLMENRHPPRAIRKRRTADQAPGKFSSTPTSTPSKIANTGLLPRRKATPSTWLKEGCRFSKTRGDAGIQQGSLTKIRDPVYRTAPRTEPSHGRAGAVIGKMAATGSVSSTFCLVSRVSRFVLWLASTNVIGPIYLTFAAIVARN